MLDIQHRFARFTPPKHNLTMLSILCVFFGLAFCLPRPSRATSASFQCVAQGLFDEMSALQRHAFATFPSPAPPGAGG